VHARARSEYRVSLPRAHELGTELPRATKTVDGRRVSSWCGSLSLRSAPLCDGGSEPCVFLIFGPIWEIIMVHANAHNLLSRQNMILSNIVVPLLGGFLRSLAQECVDEWPKLTV